MESMSDMLGRIPNAVMTTDGSAESGGAFFVVSPPQTESRTGSFVRANQKRMYSTAKDSITADCSYTKVTIRKLPRLCGREGCSQLSYTCITPVPPALGRRWRAVAQLVALADETRTRKPGTRGMSTVLLGIPSQRMTDASTETDALISDQCK